MSPAAAVLLAGFWVPAWLAWRLGCWAERRWGQTGELVAYVLALLAVLAVVVATGNGDLR